MLDDLNSKSPLWGNTKDGRVLDMTVMNVEDEPAFVIIVDRT